MKRFLRLISIPAFIVLACVFWQHIEIITNWVVARAGCRASVPDRLRQYEPRVIETLKPKFASRGVEFPPSGFVLVAIKDAALLQLFAYGSSGRPVHIKDYPILGLSGTLGPKLREGDRQVPEGIYRVTSLNPNSICHLSLRLDYPNEFDRSTARRDGRTRLGNDIMIHGKSLSVGCLAIGDTAVEEVFVLAARSGVQNVKVVIVPTDWRKRTFNAKLVVGPAWLAELYAQLDRELQRFQQE